MKSRSEKADYYGCSKSTLQRMENDGVDTDRASAMLSWALTKKQQPKAFLDRLQELTGIKRESADGVDPDWEEFQRTTNGRVDDDPKQAMASVAKARAFAAFKFDKASSVGNQREMKFYADLLAKLESTLHDQQLRAKKLGIDAGELVPRSEMERIARAWVFWAMRAVDADLADLCPKLTGLAQVKDVRAVLEPSLLSNRFLKPFARASRIDSPSALPAWMVETLRDSVDDFLENGAEEFDR